MTGWKLLVYECPFPGIPFSLPVGENSGLADSVSLPPLASKEGADLSERSLGKCGIELAG